MPYTLKNTESILYADDTTIVNTCNNTESLLIKNNDSIRLANELFAANKLTVNEDKNQNILFTLKKESYTFGTPKVKLLGLTIQYKLDWRENIELLGKELSKVLYLLKSMKTSVSLHILRTLYFSTLHSKMIYGILLWGNSPANQTIFILQKKALRIMFNLNFNEHCRETFIQQQILTFPCCCIFENLVYVKKWYHDYKEINNVHTYNTRNNNKLLLPKIRLKKSELSSNFIGIQLFNKLPENIKTLNVKQFKLSVKRLLLNNAFYSINEYMSFYM